MTRVAAFCFALFFLPSLALTQEKLPHSYHLTFLVQELDGGTIINSREFSATGATECSVRSNSQQMLRISETQMQNYDIGVSIDARKIIEADGFLSLVVTAALSSIMTSDPKDHLPIIRKQSWSGEALVPMRRPTVIFSADDVTSKHKIQLVLSASQIK